MVLVSSDASDRRRVREVLSTQSPSSDPQKPISIQDLRPWPYHPDGVCDCEEGFEGNPRVGQSNLYFEGDDGMYVVFAKP